MKTLFFCFASAIATLVVSHSTAIRPVQEDKPLDFDFPDVPENSQTLIFGPEKVEVFKGTVAEVKKAFAKWSSDNNNKTLIIDRDTTTAKEGDVYILSIFYQEITLPKEFPNGIPEWRRGPSQQDNRKQTKPPDTARAFIFISHYPRNLYFPGM
jgi:hypothetical protein